MRVRKVRSCEILMSFPVAFNGAELVRVRKEAEKLKTTAETLVAFNGAELVRVRKVETTIIDCVSEIDPFNGAELVRVRKGNNIQRFTGMKDNLQRGRTRESSEGTHN